MFVRPRPPNNVRNYCWFLMVMVKHNLYAGLCIETSTWNRQSDGDRDREREEERIWPKLTRPEIKNELKEKALRFRRGGDRARAPHGAKGRSKKWGQIRINEAREGRTDADGRTELRGRAFFDAKKIPCFLRFSATRAHPGRARHPREPGQRHQPHLHHIVQPRAARIRLLVSGK